MALGRIAVGPPRSALQLQRLTNTWANISSRSRERFAALQALTSPQDNYARYRQRLARCTAQRGGQRCLPYLAVLTKDLVGKDLGLRSAHIQALPP